MFLRLNAVMICIIMLIIIMIANAMLLAMETVTPVFADLGS